MNKKCKLLYQKYPSLSTSKDGTFEAFESFINNCSSYKITILLSHNNTYIHIYFLIDENKNL